MRRLTYINISDSEETFNARNCDRERERRTEIGFTYE